MKSKLLYINGDFFLLEGSIIANNKIIFDEEMSDSDKLRYRKIVNFREENSEFLDETKDGFILNKNIKVNSCSLAACIVKGYKAINGWDAWKNKDKKSMDQVIRKEDKKSS